MTEAELRTKSNEYNAATAVTMGYQEIRNSAENWHDIMKAFAEGRAKDLSSEPKKLLKPVILTGSGPSLDDSIEKLRDWKGDIICHYSQALTLRYYGIIPDYIVALDAICNWEGLKGVEWAGTKTKLVLHPGMWPSLVKNWPNEMLFYRQNLGKPDAFGVNEQKIMYTERMGTLEDALASRVQLKSMINTELTMFACTPPTQLFVAQVLQYGNVFLTGMDFAYHSGKERFTNWTINDDGEWAKTISLIGNQELITTNNGLVSEPLHLYYLKNMVSACRLSMQQVYTTDHGAMTQLPYIDMDKVIATDGKKVPKIDPAVRAKTYERYLASIHCFAITFEKGLAFVEVQDPIRDVTGFIQQKNRMYKCKACGADGMANDDIDHDGGKCQTCGKDSMFRVAHVDLKENINRIQALIDYNKAEK